MLRNVNLSLIRKAYGPRLPLTHARMRERVGGGLRCPVASRIGGVGSR